MIKINENNKVNARDIYSYVDVKTRFNDWVRNCIDYADLKEGKDFCAKLSKSTGGRPATDFEFTVDAAKEVCIVSATPKAKELRRWLIGLSKQVENLDLITVKQAAFAVKVVNCLKYISNQKEAYSLHQKYFIEKEGMSNYVYSDFAKYRANIVGWDKNKIDKALQEYLNNHSGYNRAKVSAKSMSDKLSIIDVNEAMRVAVLDILSSKGTDQELSNKFANLVKKMSKELNIEPLSKNETNLFQNKEQIDSVKTISLK